MRRFLLCVLLLQLLAACGSDPCPAGTVSMGDVCVGVDGGDSDGAMRDAPAGDTGPGDSGPTCSGYTDGDEDGAGAGAEVTGLACPLPTGYVDTSDDCDDADGTAYPGADEACDDVDDDCDGRVDEGRLAAIGKPVMLSSNAGETNGIDIDAYSDGYVVAWEQADADEIRYRSLDVNAAPNGSPHTAATTDVANPAILIAEESVPPRVLVAWTVDARRLEVRSVLADGTGSSSIEIVASGTAVFTGAALTRTTGSIGISWAQYASSNSRLWVRDLDPATATSGSPAVMVADLGNLVPFRPGARPSASGGMWLAAPVVEGSARNGGVWTLEPDGPSWAVMGSMYTVGGLSDVASAALAASTEDDLFVGVGWNLGSGVAGVVPPGPLSPVSSTTVIMDGDGSVFAAMPTTTGTIRAELFESTTTDWRQVDVAGPSGDVHSVAVAMRDAAHGALAYTVTMGGAAPQAFVQALGCQ